MNMSYSSEFEEIQPQMRPRTPVVAGGEIAASHAWPVRSAYIHVPFCAHRCGYCNFTLVSNRDDLADAYVRSIEIELQSLGSPQPMETLYFGGGTPTQLAPRLLDRLLTVTRTWLVPTGDYEFTVEANPDDLTAEKGEVLRAHGVNRLSLGAQSFDTVKLRALDRTHSTADIDRSLEIAARIGAAAAVDLIFASPGESLATWERDLRMLIARSPQHASTYGLTWEKGTRFWSQKNKGKLAELDEELQRTMYLRGIALLGEAGLEHYEVSNFARPGERSRHNQVYWRGDGFYGFGPGAARYVDGNRSVNHRSTTTYLQRVLEGKSPIAESESLNPESRARERLVFALRMLEGVDLAAFERATGFSVEHLAAGALEGMIQRGLLQHLDGRLRLTRQGLLVSDSIWPYFLVPSATQAR